MLLSSGTTGAFKRVGLSWDVIDASVRNAVIAYGPAAGGPWLLGPGMDTVLGFTVTLAAWAAGHCVALGALDWAAAPGLIGLVPFELERMLAALPAGFVPPRPLRLVVTGGRLSPALAREAAGRLTPDIRTVYGATECGAAAIGDALHPDSAGYAMPDVALHIEGGEVRIRSPRLGVYLPPIPPGGGGLRDGACFPGDLGRLDPDGRLWIEGRVDELINFGGVKLAPEAVERALAGPDVADLAAFAGPDAERVVRAWVAVARGPGFAQEEFTRRMQARLAAFGELVTLYVDRIPRNAMGKIDRPALRVAARGVRIYADGSSGQS